MKALTSVTLRTALPLQQKGASLFIALIILLIVTLLALSSARETTLESRITGNYIEQQRLANAAEASLRDGENIMQATNKPREPQTTVNCTATATEPCFLVLTASNTQDFTHAQSYNPTDGTTLERTAQWYAQEASCDNVSYGDKLRGGGTFCYEINSRAFNGAGAEAKLRSVVRKVFVPN